MLSCMDTPLGFTVVSPDGKPFRLSATHPAYRAGRELVRQPLPAEQIWHQLQTLVANPLGMLAGWCERFGVALSSDTTSIHMNDRALQKDLWLPLLQRAHNVGASPIPVMQFAEKLGASAEFAKVGTVTLHVSRPNEPAAIVREVMLPEEASVGDLVVPSSTGNVPFLVSYWDYSVSPSGDIRPLMGTVLARINKGDDVKDILAQPVILGMNQTYRCEEGSKTGWLEDLSFDSLKAAQRNAKEIAATGAEVRIVNRTTGDIVALDP